MTVPPRVPAAERPPHDVPPPELRTYTRWPGIFAMIAPFVVSPLVALTNEEVSYVVVPWACYRDAAAWLRVVPILSLVVLAVLALLSLRDWRRTGGGTETSDATVADRTRFVALAGLGITGISGLAVLWQFIATWVVHPCLRS